MNYRTKSLLAGGVGIWSILVGAGIWRLNAFAASPGTTAVRPDTWSDQSAIPSRQTIPTLIMVLHPRCPCSRASLGELHRLLAQLPGRVRAIVLFVVPEGMSPGWERGDLWNKAKSISGVEVRRDHSGAEAERLGAETSGDCFLFAAEGKRLFAGGITEMRGHEGESAGRTALATFISGREAATTRTAVFGCPLQTETTTSSRK